MRFISASYRLAMLGRAGGGASPPPSFRTPATLFRQRVVFGEVGAQLFHGRVGIDAGLLDGIGPGLDQRFRRLLPLRGLRRGELVDFMTGLGLDLADAGVLELAPRLADTAGRFGGAVVVDRLLLAVGHLII